MCLSSRVGSFLHPCVGRGDAPPRPSHVPHILQRSPGRHARHARRRLKTIKSMPPLNQEVYLCACAGGFFRVLGVGAGETGFSDLFCGFLFCGCLTSAWLQPQAAWPSVERKGEQGSQLRTEGFRQRPKRCHFGTISVPAVPAVSALRAACVPVPDPFSNAFRTSALHWRVSAAEARIPATAQKSRITASRTTAQNRQVHLSWSRTTSKSFAHRD